jgi:hypothetical protein
MINATSVTKKLDSILEDSAIAQKILQLLGGRFFVMAIGAKDLTSSGNSLSLKFVKRVKDGANYLTVTLTGSDKYTMDFGQLRGNDVKRVTILTGLNGNKLQPTFSTITGLVINVF